MKTELKRKRTATWQVLLDFAVAGLQYHDFDITKIKRGDRVQLYHQPSNKHDPSAIKVCVAGRHIGYVPRDLTARLHFAKMRGNKFYVLVNQVFPHEEIERMVWIKVKVKQV